MARSSVARLSEDRSSWSGRRDRKSTRLNSSHANISYAVFCLKKKKKQRDGRRADREARDHARINLDVSGTRMRAWIGSHTRMRRRMGEERDRGADARIVAGYV